MPVKPGTKSLERTGSTGNLNVFLVIEKKLDHQLLIVSREQLPPTMRVGKLILKQNVTLRDNDRTTVEGKIVFMHPDRQICAEYKRKILEERLADNTDEASDESLHPQPSRSRIIIGDSGKERDASKKTIETHSQVTKKTQLFQAIETSLPRGQNLDLTPEYEEPNIFDETDEVNDRPSTNPSNRNELTTIDQRPSLSAEALRTSVAVTQPNDSDILLQKLNLLSLKLEEKQVLIKQQEDEIKRLKATSLPMPTDQTTRDYLIYIANKVRQQTTKFQYSGSLATDANILGVSLTELNEILSSNTSVTSIARYLFKKIVPPHRRNVENWNKLEEDVRAKEKVLINFLERYFGPLECDRRKLHVSIVGCLRNERSSQKKQTKTSTNDGNQLQSIESTDLVQYDMNDKNDD